MKSKPNGLADISIIIPFFNDQKGLNQALESIYNQSVLPREIVIVNDGSSHVPIFSTPEANQIRVRIISRTNGGQASARNLGVKLAASKYVCFLDQDDLYLVNHLEIMAGLIEPLNDDWAFGYSQALRVDLKNRTALDVHNFPNRKRHPITIQNAFYSNLEILPGSIIISKKWFDKIGGFDERLRGYEDDDLVIRLLSGGGHATYSQSPSLLWLNNRSSTSYSPSMDSSGDIFFSKWLTIASDSNRAEITARVCLQYLYRLWARGQKLNSFQVLLKFLGLYFVKGSQNTSFSKLALLVIKLGKFTLLQCLGSLNVLFNLIFRNKFSKVKVIFS